VGFAEGKEVGLCEVGSPVGEREGVLLGTAVGVVVGIRLEGDLLGNAVTGDNVVGDRVVGTLEGKTLGTLDGLCVGAKEGRAVGDVVDTQIPGLCPEQPTRLLPCLHGGQLVHVPLRVPPQFARYCGTRNAHIHLAALPKRLPKRTTGSGQPWHR